jgi:hypothetical protein
MMQPRVQIGIAILFSVFLHVQGCDPGYWVGVRANLKEPISPECIENTLHALPEIDKLMIQKSDPRDAWYLPRTSMVQQPPDQYMFEAGDDKGEKTCSCSMLASRFK